MGTLRLVGKKSTPFFFSKIVVSQSEFPRVTYAYLLPSVLCECLAKSLFRQKTKNI